jgi:enhancing lycopene biosynthesis protein 2
MIFIDIFNSITIFQLLMSAAAKTEKKIGVILSGCGMMDGTEVYEAAFTVLALEKAGAKAVFMAPDINQASVVNHLKNDAKVEGTRNTLIESARIARGDIKNIKDINSADLDGLIIVGGIGSMCAASMIIAKIFGDKNVKITIGPANDYFGPMIESFGAQNAVSKGRDMVIDKNNKIVSTPAVMSGKSNANIYRYYKDC